MSAWFECALLALAIAACSAGREGRVVDILSSNYCDETADDLAQEVRNVERLAEESSDIMRLADQIADARHRVNKLKGSCANQADVIARVEAYEARLEAIEEKYLWGR